MTRSLLHTPTVRARLLARSGDTADYLHALHILFGIDITGSENPHPPAGPAGDGAT